MSFLAKNFNLLVVQIYKFYEQKYVWLIQAKSNEL